MNKIMVTKGTTVRLKSAGDFLSTDSSNTIHLKKGTVLELLEVMYTSESMLAIDTKTKVKFLLPQLFAVDNCEIVMLPQDKKIDNLYILHEEFKDHIDVRHITIICLIINIVILLLSTLSNIFMWLKLG